MLSTTIFGILGLDSDTSLQYQSPDYEIQFSVLNKPFDDSYDTYELEITTDFKPFWFKAPYIVFMNSPVIPMYSSDYNMVTLPALFFEHLRATHCTWILLPADTLPPFPTLRILTSTPDGRVRIDPSKLTACFADDCPQNPFFSLFQGAFSGVAPTLQDLGRPAYSSARRAEVNSLRRAPDSAG